MFGKPREILMLLLLMASFAFTPQAMAAPLAAFPTKPVSVIVALSPGGLFDLYGRGVAKFIKKRLKVPTIVKNVTGAGGRTGTNFLYRSKPDGHTIGVVNVVGLAGYQMVKSSVYDINRFQWLGMVGSTKYIMWVPKKSPYKSIKDLKEAPKPIRLGCTGVSATGTIVTFLANQVIGIPYTNVCGFKGFANVLPALLRGDVDFMYASSSTYLSAYKAGDMRPLFSLSVKPDPLFPNLPTIADLGYPQAAAENTGIALLFPFAAPPNISKDRLAILRKAFMETVQSQEFKDWAKSLRLSVTPINGKETSELVSRLNKLFDSRKASLKRLFKNPNAVFR